MLNAIFKQVSTERKVMQRPWQQRTQQARSHEHFQSSTIPLRANLKVSKTQKLTKRKVLRTNKPEKTQYTSKHFHNQNLDEEIGVRSVAQCCGGSSDSDAYTAEEVACANGQAAPEQSVAGEVVLGGVDDKVGQRLEFG